MIVVDSSVLIDFFRARATVQVQQLQGLIGREPILIGDVVLCEILQGARSEAEARQLNAELSAFDLAPMLNPELAILAASHYRRLRTLGHTMRKTIDVIIGTFCIANGYWLLHSDRDYDPMETYLGLRVV